jgi:UDPglucose 6-dehydrogenase
LTIRPILADEGARIKVFDPQGRRYGEALLPGVAWCAGALEAAEGADIVVVLTEWNEFRAIDLANLKQAMRGNLLVDARNVYRPSHARAAGLRYLGIGRPCQPAHSELPAEPLVTARGNGHAAFGFADTGAARAGASHG